MLDAWLRQEAVDVKGEKASTLLQMNKEMPVSGKKKVWGKIVFYTIVI